MSMAVKLMMRKYLFCRLFINITIPTRVSTIDINNAKKKPKTSKSGVQGPLLKFPDFIK